MQLKRLEIHGFKSFIEPVNFSFGYPIIAIVGPNGSGKSNIVDAIKWCMGEQGTKQLRASQMSDLIFNGSEHRKPVGMAEVSLIFENNGGNVPSEYASFSEIAVTRRAYRDGESEYYINKEVRRLKDIIELLIDIGISSKAYSIIEQGQIGEIINVKPEMRRYVIEEAAGILKYKNRKKIAIDKIEITKTSMARIVDLLSELKRQLSQVGRQVKIAQDYKTMKDEYKNLDIGIMKTDHAKIISENENKKSSLEQIRFEIAKLSSRSSARYVDYQRFKGRLDKQASDISEKQMQINNLTSESMVLKERIESSNRLKEAIHIENQKIHSSIEEQQKKELSTREQIAKIKKDIEVEHKELITFQEELKALERQKDELFEQVNELKNRLEEEKDNEFNRARKITEIDNQILSIEHEVKSVTYRLEKLEHDRSVIEQKIIANKEEKKHLEGDEKSIEVKQSLLDSKIKDLKDLIESLSVEIEDINRIIEQKKNMHEGVRSRCATLEDLRKNLDGYSDGARFIIKQKEQFDIDKVVADYIKVSPGYELAVQSALDDVVQGIITSDYEKVEQIINALRKGDSGRAIFIIGSDIKIGEKQKEKNGILLADVIEITDEHVKPLVQALIDDVYVVDNLKDAFAHAKSGRFAVTVNGDLVKPGIVYGGSNNAIKGGIIYRRHEADELKEKLELLSKEISQAELKKQELADKIDNHRAELSSIISSRQETERQGLGIAARLQNINEQIGNHESAIIAIDIEQQELRKNESELYEEVADIRQKKAIYEEDSGTNVNLIDSLREGLTNMESQLEDKKQAVSDYNSKIAVLKERSNTRMREIERMEYDYESVKQSISLAHQEEANNKTKLDSIEQEIITSNGKLSSKNEDLVLLQNQLVDSKTVYDRDYKEYSEIEKEIKEIEKELNTIKEKESAQSIELAELTMKAGYIADTAKDKYNIILEHFETEILPENDIKNTRDKVLVLSEKIAKMGDVNLGAITEYEDLQKRVSFYEKQKQDLDKAIEDLKRIINSINRESRKLFRDVFDKVNENFKQVVPKLYDGGRGELILTDEQDLLESGMEIIIQPPGKRLQDISLLSGGEKALGAIALLISVFMVKPSPFALLDEIDAPLDDASVVKLNNVIKELSKNTQFILITHNKKTIEIADALYGITMEEPGVSKVISVKLKREAV
ncbi:MAG: chromosome segregation protein SMC [Deltaproteobacteria bacterium]|nr:chromosome segregation protein SMC [Deltaproteobacteria bacterium]MCL5792564.1 chromosome segregation protein SMC [Deltaproteobacteria bacterium]